MSRLTESAIEEFAIKLFERLGYDTIYAPDIAPDSNRPERSRYDEVILRERLKTAVRRINSTVPDHALRSTTSLSIRRGGVSSQRFVGFPIS